MMYAIAPRREATPVVGSEVTPAETPASFAVGMSVRKLSAWYGRRQAIRDVTLDIGDRQVTAIVTECIAFLVQLTDRAVHGRSSDAERATLINAVATHLAKTMENNQLDLLGPGDYRTPFIQTLNDRFDDYAQFEYVDREPGYACVRYFGSKVSEAMASSDNKWVIEQMMEIEAPEMVRCIRKLVAEIVAADAAPTPAQS